MLKRLFPTIAQLTSDWPPEKWMLAPLAVLVLVIMFAGILHAIAPGIAHEIVRLLVGRPIPTRSVQAWAALPAAVDAA